MSCILAARRCWPASARLGSPGDRASRWECAQSNLIGAVLLRKSPEPTHLDESLPASARAWFPCIRASRELCWARIRPSTEGFYYDRIGTEIFARKRDVDLIPALLRRQRVESYQQKFEASFLGTDQTQGAIELLTRVQPLPDFKFCFCAPGRDHVVIDHRSIFRLHF